MHVRNLCLIVLSCCVRVYGQYDVPEALVEALPTKGFSISIPDEAGIKLFAIHGKLNEELDGREGGTFSRDINKAKNGRWTFTDKATKLKPGDVLYYWTYVDYFDGERKLGYVRDDQNFTFTDIPGFVATTTTAKPTSDCVPTVTRANKKKTCAGRLLFTENFGNNFELQEKWEKEVIYAGEPDYEYVLYSDDSKNIYTSKNILYIKPTLTEDKYGAGFTSNQQGLDLGTNCTGIPGTLDCYQKAQAYLIIPPVISARINTKNQFSFVYGLVEVRAKLPKGDWIYPEIYLNPKNYEYGAGYESGQIRIAFLPGNQLMNKKLYGGCILGSTVSARNFAMKSVEQATGWSDEFHVFTLTWEPESISLAVDNELYGRIYPSAGGFASKEQELGLTAAHRWRGGTTFAPFDVEMYLSIGVGVGGHSFPDGPSKPWVNNDPKAQKMFHRAIDTWYHTWGTDSALQVDYVKVYALNT